MPAIAVAFDTTYGTVQLVLTVYLFGFAGAQLVYGPLSDRFGRRPVLLVGLLLYITGTLTCLFAPIVEVMIAGRLVQAIGGCSGMIMARAIVRDVYDREGSATTLASVLTAAALGPMVAPLIGGYLQAWFGWQANFMVLLAAGIGILIACWFLLNETLGERRPMASPIDMVLDFAKLMRFPSFWGYTCQPAFNAAVFFAFVGGAPYVLVEILGRPPPGVRPLHAVRSGHVRGRQLCLPPPDAVDRVGTDDSTGLCRQPDWRRRPRRAPVDELSVSRTRFPWTQNWLNRSVQGGPEHDR